MSTSCDLILDDGLVFDGLGSPPRRASVGIRDGVIQAITTEQAELMLSATGQRIDAAGKWVVPGFIDIHTHYDAEIEVAPGLSESVRHGVTTVMLGSCSLSLAIGAADELSDMYCRVEALPDDIVRPILRRVKTWDGHASYFAHLRSLPIGPNVASFMGHSAIRASVMGIERSLDKHIRPTKAEMQKMLGMVQEGLDAGYVGLSVQTLPWDKMGGSRDYRSRPLPSTFASWSEYRKLLAPVRQRNRVFQGVPNVSTKWNSILFLLESAAIFRKALKTTIISMMDLKSSPGIHRFIGAVSRLFNRVLGANFRWQALPEPFDLWADGMELVVFEEFGAGARALHELTDANRSQLARDPAYRAGFRKQWTSKLLPKAFHRNLAWSTVLACPDASIVGKSFAQIARDRSEDPVECFLELIARHGNQLRWYTMMANDREDELQWIMNHPDVLIGFSDAGAHLRQMAHYNFPLRMLKRVVDAQRSGSPFMSPERAVHRLTGEIASWFGLDTGTIEVGKRADLSILNPAALGDDLEQATEAPLDGFGGFQRLVRRNDGAVDAVVIGGSIVVRHGRPVDSLGARAFGKVLEAA